MPSFIALFFSILAMATNKPAFPWPPPHPLPPLNGIENKCQGALACWDGVAAPTYFTHQRAQH